MSDNARINAVADGITTEAIAEWTHIKYQPETGGGYISFQYRPSLYVGTEFKGPAGDWSTLQMDIAAVAERCFYQGVNPVTGNDLSKINVLDVAAIIKQAFDIGFNEQAAAAAAGEAGA